MTPIHELGDAIRHWLQLIPLPVVRATILTSLVGLLVWVLLLPKSATAPPGGAKRWDENLKYGAALTLIIQIIIYSLL